MTYTSSLLLDITYEASLFHPYKAYITNPITYVFNGMEHQRMMGKEDNNKVQSDNGALTYCYLHDHHKDLAKQTTI